jgi:threonyl-tRNA synthetase
VSQKFEEYGRRVEQQMTAAGLRVQGDYRPEKIGAKIRDAQLELVPYMFVVGQREVDGGTVAVRDRLEGDLGAMRVEEAIHKLQEEIHRKTVRKTYAAEATVGEQAADNEY